jgi:predicted amidophosphoribosyltransferase
VELTLSETWPRKGADDPPSLRDFLNRLCFACASALIEPLAESRCEVCELELDAFGVCNNPVCNFSDRGFQYVYAISMMTGALREAIIAYKYKGMRAWASIFGRVLAGYLDDNVGAFERVDLIVPSPTFIGEGATRNWDHTDAITRTAADEAEREWPFDLDTPHVIVQVATTDRFVGKTWKERQKIAEGPLRAALTVPDPGLVRDRSILVFDDVFTDGLRVVLARQPYRG